MIVKSKICWLRRFVRALYVDLCLRITSVCQVTFNTDRMESVIYSEKVVRSTFVPSLSHFGGKPSDGWLAVTGTGLVSD